MLRDRFSRSLGVAIVLHGVVAWEVRGAIRAQRIEARSSAPIEVEELAEAPAPSLPSPPPTAPSEARVATMTPARKAASRTLPTSRSPEAATAASPDAPPTTPAPSASAEAWSPSILRPGAPQLASLGLTAKERARTLTNEVRAAPSATPDVAGMTGILAAQDLAAGMGRGGPLLAAIEDVTSSSRVPVNGSASFVIDANASGEVTSVRVADVSSDEESWREVAELLLAKMKSHPLHVRPGWRNGVTVTLQVRSRLQLADGSPPPKERPPLGVRMALFPIKALIGAATFDVTELDPHVFRRIDAWETDERPR